MLFHYEIEITTGRCSWTYKCSTLTEAFRAIDEAVSELELPIESGVMDEYMESLVVMSKTEGTMQVRYAYFLLRKAAGEV